MINFNLKHITIALISVVAIFCCIILIQTEDNSNKLPSSIETRSGNLEIVPANNQNIESASSESDKQIISLNNKSLNIREPIENIDANHLASTKWRIVDSCNNPRPGVHVICTPISKQLVQEWLQIEENLEEPTPKLLETYADDRGCFDFPCLNPGRYLVRADAPGWSPALGLLDIETEKRNDFTAVMAKEKIIRGTVHDCNHLPISEALVFCYMSPTYPIENMPLDHAGEVVLFEQQQLTDENGRFAFGGLFPSRSYNLYAENEGCISLDKTVSINDREDQILILKRSCILEGKITGYDGKPLNDANVEFCDPQSPYSFFSVELLGHEGLFRGDALPEGVIRLQGRHEDYGHDMIELYLRPDKINHAELKLPKGIKVRIKVTDEEGIPLEGIRVSVKVQDTGAYLCSTLTDESGEIVATSLIKGVQNSIFVRDLQQRYSVHDKTYMFNEDSELHIELVKRKPIQITIRDKYTKEIISNYKVCVCSYYKSSALQEFTALNTFTFEHDISTPVFDLKIAKGEFFEITVLAEGYMPERVMAMVPEDGELQPIEIFVKPGKVLNGSILDADTSNPVSGAKVQLYVNGVYDKKPSYPLSKERTSVTGEDGTFSLSSMPDYRYFLKVTAPEYTPAVVDSLELDMSTSAIENCIFINKGGRLSGRVYAYNDSPLDQAYVQIKLDETNELLTARSNSDGRYNLYNIPPGEHIVYAWNVLDKAIAKSTMKIQKKILIKQGQETVTDFNFNGSCIIRGLCTVDGKEGSGIVIDLYDSNGIQTHSVDSASTGYYKISGISHGTYLLQAHSTLIGAGGVIKRPITLARGQDLTLNLDFKGKAIHGNIKDASGQNLHAAEVELLTPSFQRSYLTYTDSEGCYAIFNVEEDNYLIAARATGCGEEMKGPWLLGGKGKQARKVDFILKPGGTTRVHVTNQGSPLAGATVLVSNNMNKGVLWTGKTKYSGMAIFENLQAESMSAIAICKGYAPASTTFVAPAGDITDAEIDLTKGGNFKLDVRNDNGIPVSDAQVLLLDYSILGLSLADMTKLGLLTPSNTAFLTDESGAFSLGRLPCGSYKIQVCKGLWKTQASVTVSENQETAIHVILK